MILRICKKEGCCFFSFGPFLAHGCMYPVMHAVLAVPSFSFWTLPATFSFESVKFFLFDNFRLIWQLLRKKMVIFMNTVEKSVCTEVA